MIMMSIVVAIFTAPINLFIDYLFVDVLSAPTVDDAKMQKEHGTKQSQLGRMVKKAGESVRRASAVTADAVKVARRRFGMGTHEAMQIPESTMEAHELARESSQHIIQERRDILEREKSFRHDNRSQVLLQRHQHKRATKYHLSEGQLKRTRDDSREGEELNELFSEFVVDLNEQRRVLKPSTRERYDSQWG
jgi:hypothetical protein